jgi:hypothetical protein
MALRISGEPKQKGLQNVLTELCGIDWDPHLSVLQRSNMIKTAAARSRTNNNAVRSGPGRGMPVQL